MFFFSFFLIPLYRVTTSCPPWLFSGECKCVRILSCLLSCRLGQLGAWLSLLGSQWRTYKPHSTPFSRILGNTEKHRSFFFSICSRSTLKIGLQTPWNSSPVHWIACGKSVVNRAITWGIRVNDEHRALLLWILPWRRRPESHWWQLHTYHSHLSHGLCIFPWQGKGSGFYYKDKGEREHNQYNSSLGKLACGRSGLRQSNLPLAVKGS